MNNPFRCFNNSPEVIRRAVMLRSGMFFRVLSVGTFAGFWLTAVAASDQGRVQVAIIDESCPFEFDVQETEVDADRVDHWMREDAAAVLSTEWQPRVYAVPSSGSDTYDYYSLNQTTTEIDRLGTLPKLNCDEHGLHTDDGSGRTSYWNIDYRRNTLEPLLHPKERVWDKEVPYSGRWRVKNEGLGPYLCMGADTTCFGMETLGPYGRIQVESESDFGKYTVIVYKGGSAGTSQIVGQRYAAIYSVVEERLVGICRLASYDVGNGGRRLDQKQWEFSADSVRCGGGPEFDLEVRFRADGYVEHFK